MIAENGLSCITVAKLDLLIALKKNREDHRTAFVASQKGYHIAVVKELESMLVDARSGKAYRKVVQLEEPLDHTRDYDRIIRMLEMSVNNEIVITESEFNNYVLDDWSWKRQFMQTTRSYT